MGLLQAHQPVYRSPRESTQPGRPQPRIHHTNQVAQTKEKLKFNEDLRKHVPPEQLDKKFGGDCDFEYDHAKFWPEFNRLANEKRAQCVARWKAGGSKVGASEFELKG